MLDMVERFNHVIAGIYDAALDIDRWPQLLNDLAAMTGADSGLVITSTGTGREVRGLASDRIAPCDIQYYSEAMFPADNLTSMMRNVPQGQLTQSDCMRGRNGILQSQFLDTWYRPQGIWHFIGAFVYHDDDHWSALSLNRGSEKTTFEPDSRRLLEMALPHMWRAQQIACGRAAMPASEMQAGILDLLGQATIAFDDRAHIVHLNDCARQWITGNPGFTASIEGLIHQAPGDSRRALIVRADTIRRCRGVQSMVLPCSADGRAQPRAVLLSADILERAGLAGGRRIAAVLVIDTRDPAGNAAADLGETLGLTAAEARVAAAALRHFSIGDISRRLNISRETVRTHLKRIYAKAEVKGHCELIALARDDPSLWAASMRRRDFPTPDDLRSPITMAA